MNEKFMGDRESYDALVDLLPAEQSSEYRGFRFLGLESAFPGRKMVAYTLKDGVPDNVQILTFGPILVEVNDGPTAEVFNDMTGQSHRLTPVPQRVFNLPLYLHMPQKFDLRWVGKRGKSGVNFAAHYAVLIKSRSKPDRLVNGETYCVKLNEFRSMFPDLNLRY